MTRPIPSIKECLAFIEHYEMLDNIRDHSFMVARVAKALVDGLIRNSAPFIPDSDEVIAGALLHDIAKTRCLKNNGHHAKDGQSICNELGYPHIGEIVLDHVVLKDFNEELYKKGEFGSKELVYYADKRVRHDQVVSLQERLDYIIERYGDGDRIKEEHITRNFSATLQFEKFLFVHLDFEPNNVTIQLKDNFLARD
jgi:putative nucleotidyltransferase with HDIG domain